MDAGSSGRSVDRAPGTTSRIVVAPKRHFPEEQLAPLVDGLRELGFEVEVEPWENPFVNGRYGVTWWEVVHVYLPQAWHVVQGLGGAKFALDTAKALAQDEAKAAAKALAKRVAAVFIPWARARSKVPGKNPKQPKALSIYGPDGKTVVLTVKITDPDEEPQIIEAKD